MFSLFTAATPFVDKRNMKNAAEFSVIPGNALTSHNLYTMTQLLINVFKVVKAYYCYVCGMHFVIIFLARDNVRFFNK